MTSHWNHLQTQHKNDARSLDKTLNGFFATMCDLGLVHTCAGIFAKQLSPSGLSSTHKHIFFVTKAEFLENSFKAEDF